MNSLDGWGLGLEGGIEDGIEDGIEGDVEETIVENVLALFAERGWQPFPFQIKTWRAYLAGQSGLIHAPTGMGKSYAAWLGPLIEWMAQNPDREKWAAMQKAKKEVPLTVLWVTPLRALAKDTVATLNRAVDTLGVPWRVELRTGDTSSSAKQRQRRKPPTALVTTPESLSLLLSYPDAEEKFRHLHTVIVDEWHELLGTKRGTQTELALARLRMWRPQLRTWGLSATLGNLTEALDVLVPTVTVEAQDDRRRSESDAKRVMIAGDMQKEVEIETLIPDNIERFPWAGHLGLKMLPQVVERVVSATSTLIFCNTRAQTELWFQAIIDYTIEHAPELIGAVGIHHGSVEPEMRAEVEERLSDGRLRCVICTSSLDLGVDFSPVAQVMQIGSPKGVARLLQRAGRSGHQPGAVSRIFCVPTHAFELIEFAATRDAMERGELEARKPLRKPLDVLVQHLVTIAFGGGFTEQALLDEVRTAYAYRDLTEQEWRWCMDFVTFGGESLRAYDEYAKVKGRNGRYLGSSPKAARRHRMSIGTITSDGMLNVKYLNGGSIGSVEESFAARLKPGDVFIFAGRLLEFRRLRDMTVQVRRAKQAKGIVPRWGGSRMQLSTQLADAVRLRLSAAELGIWDTPEMQAVKPLLDIQQKWSQIPAADELVIERVKTREGWHFFFFPLAGRLVHEGLNTLLAFRLSRLESRSISAFVNDYGCELLSPTEWEIDEETWRQVLSTDNLLDDILDCLNETELARRQFRDIARVAGLIFSGYPGGQKSNRQLQSSSGVIFDVFSQYDPDNLLLDQARREVLEQQLDIYQLRITLEKLERAKLVQIETKRLTPLAFPIWTSRIRTQVSSETWTDRVQRMLGQLEKAAG